MVGRGPVPAIFLPPSDEGGVCDSRRRERISYVFTNRPFILTTTIQNDIFELTKGERVRRMTKEQLKMWMKIIGFVILLAFGGLIIAGIVDGTGFVHDYFYVPFLFVIPLLFIIPIVILYVIYMFVEKGEALRIIANILACVLALYVVGGVSLLRHSEFMNSYRYKALESSAYQIVSNIFEDSTIEKDDSFFIRCINHLEI